MENREETSVDNGNRTSALSIAIAWFVVGIPLAWGVYQTFEKSLDLFR